VKWGEREHISRDFFNFDHVCLFHFASNPANISLLPLNYEARKIAFTASYMAQTVANKTVIKIPGKRTRNTTKLDVAARKKIVSPVPLYQITSGTCGLSLT
jgi:hypothetical protein